MAYKDYLLSWWWLEYRKAELQRAGYACESCGACGSELHVHHLNYRRAGQSVLGRELPGLDTEVLCQECHESRHGINPLRGLEDRLNDWLHG